MQWLCPAGQSTTLRGGGWPGKGHARHPSTPTWALEIEEDKDWCGLVLIVVDRDGEDRVKFLPRQSVITSDILVDDGIECMKGVCASIRNEA